MARLVAYLLFFIVTALFEGWSGTRRLFDRNRTLKWLARRLGGTYEPERRDFGGAVTWTLDRETAALYFLESGSGKVEGVVLRIRKPCRSRVRVFPETGWTRVRRFFGAQDVQIGDPAFDRAFMVQSNHERSARSVLTPAARASLVSLASVVPVSLDMGPNGIVIRTPHGFAHELDRLTRFTGEALTLGRALLEALDPSIVLADVESPETGACPVCATPVDGDRGVCARCRTPHHRDCWDYFGGCSVFACAGRPARLRRMTPRVVTRR